MSGWGIVGLIVGGMLIGAAGAFAYVKHEMEMLNGDLMIAESKLRELRKAATAAHHAAFGGVGIGQATVDLLWNNLWEQFGLKKMGVPK